MAGIGKSLIPDVDLDETEDSSVDSSKALLAAAKAIRLASEKKDDSALSEALKLHYELCK